MSVFGGCCPSRDGLIPVALSKSEGAGSVWILVQLPGAHLYIQVLGNFARRTAAFYLRARHFSPSTR